SPYTPAPRSTIEALRRQALREHFGGAALELARRAWLDDHDLRAARRWVRLAAVLDDDEAYFYEAWLATKGSRRGPPPDPDLVEGFALALGET
ncbi:hypothetical protein, partial [Salmonella sp. SAL4438]|uniref:hypothetical protein n=1 Tax=Salmonella sp. SAL4438 TaxID=3159893 RepID=UPI00397BA365